MAKKPVNRIKYQLEDNVKRVLFMRGGTGDGGGTPTDFEIPYATREETDAGLLTDKALNPDVGAYAYDRFRYTGQHAAGKATRMVRLEDVPLVIDCRRSNVFRILVTGDITLPNPVGGLDGQVCNIIVKQDGVGEHLVGLSNKIKTVGTMDTSAGRTSILSMQYDADDDLWYGVISAGFV